ncbi:MAG: ribonuclease H-like domain-containing protein [Nitrososphaerota archaeon]|nr:ribonuclease H-like domain-containing protein [Nitrososphaerota archaeon]MDG7040642.1 ribonuclease H-like domain-containing protein [Nitrososphaerota archaeon]MDG7042070.1 ribonuclease H-like domain-containing protein [Nitrososphaerota archaeon]MDG7046510.1 ribonuclease H-like domain-containing protein [Nitrososphaerota archaeon]MDG7048132.1 ribonuclease H-like domain-containing protein [Nitrososphaerota archaeon]
MSAPIAFLTQKISEQSKGITDLKGGFLLGAGYDGDKKLAYLKFLDTVSQSICYYYDNSGHRPYCYSKKTPSELQQLLKRPDVIAIRKEEKLEPISDQKIEVSKIITSDPLAIGGSPNSIRNIEDCYEADIKYYENYLYDLGLIACTYYDLEKGVISKSTISYTEDMSSVLQGVIGSQDASMAKYTRDWAFILAQPFPYIKRAAIDIEVFAEAENRLPDPEKAEQPIISISVVGNDGQRKAFVLRRTDVEPGDDKLPEGADLIYYDDELQLLLDFFKKMLEYPVIVTFNGDGFDLPYLYHRAQNLNVPKEAIPISIGKEVASLKHGIHVDLYKTFINRSIQGYAFSNKYSEHTLDAISQAILGEGKEPVVDSINTMTTTKLAIYNLQDSNITLGLTTFNDDLLFKLLMTISRVAKMPIEDTSRLSVSNWIRSMLIFEHRARKALVPKREEIAAKGNAGSTAIIKGKKYQGGFVVEPKPGVHFQVVVLDFASLYPSIIKVYNLSYETVKCPHPECRDNILPNTNLWVCKINKGMISLLIGSLRDIRVNYFKSLARIAVNKEQKQFYNVISQSLKVILNASYGVMGFESFPFYSLPVADSTTALGRYSIQSAITKAQELGSEVIYGDSIACDSIVVVATEGVQSGVAPSPPVERKMKVEDLFKRVDIIGDGGKEYYLPEHLFVESLDQNKMVTFAKVVSIMRHRTAKDMYRIRVDGHNIDVTEDHSLISLSESDSPQFSPIRPLDIKKETLLITRSNNMNEVNAGSGTKISILSTGYHLAHASSIEKLVGYQGYVYDLEVEGNHRFFANSVLVHNTDSLFLKNASATQIKEMERWAKEKLEIDLEIDKRYRFVAFSQRKKNYLGVYEDGSVEVKGLSGKKSHTPDYIKEAFYSVLDTLGKVKTEGDFVEAKEEIRKKIREAYLMINERKVPLEKLAFKVMLNKPVDKYTVSTPQHVKAAQLLIENGSEIKAGDVISYIKTVTPSGVKPLSLTKKEDIDTGKYVEFLESTFEQLLDALGYNFDQIIGSSRIEDFFG